jgi:hypothetical protein
MMAGSLGELAKAFTSSQFSPDGLAQVLGERAFGEVSKMVTSAFEGALVASGIVWGMARSSRSQDKALRSKLQARSALMGFRPPRS